MTESTSPPGAPSNPPRSGGAHRHPSSAHPVTAAIIAVLVVGAIVCTLYVPIYASETPKVGDFPFFYFYLLIYMPITAVALWIAMLLQRRLTGRRAGR